MSHKSIRKAVAFPAEELVYLPNFISAAESSTIFRALLAGLLWEQSTIKVFGRYHKIPRLNAFYGDPGLGYRYSGRAFRAQPWTPSLLAVRDGVAERLAIHCNCVLANWYRDGQDSMGWHADDEPELGEAPVIVTVSFGATRTLRFRHKQRSKPSFGVNLESGSVLIMGAGMQRHWQHALPKRANASARVSLTYRNLTVGL